MRVYSIRQHTWSQPFTVLDDDEAAYYRDVGFIVDESIISDKVPWITYAMLVCGAFWFYVLGGWWFGWSVVNVLYGVVLAMFIIAMLVIQMLTPSHK